VREREKTLDREIPLGCEVVKIPDEAAARIRLAFTDRGGQQVHELLPDPVAVVGFERLVAAEREDGDRVADQQGSPLENQRRQLLPQIVLQAAAVLVAAEDAVLLI